MFFRWSDSYIFKIRKYPEKTETFLLLDEKNMPLLEVPKISKEEISYAAENMDNQEIIKFNKISEQFNIDKENFLYEKSKVEKKRKSTNK